MIRSWRPASTGTLFSTSNGPRDRRGKYGGREQDFIDAYVTEIETPVQITPDTDMDEVIRRVREQTDIEQINLTVIATNLQAKRLYEKAGFRSFALELNAFKDGGLYHDEEQMVFVVNR